MLKKNEAFIQEEANQLLKSIKNRPDLEPNPQFIQELQDKLKARQTNNKSFSPRPLIALCSLALIVTVFFLSFQNSLDNNLGEGPKHAFTINEIEHKELLHQIEYGSENGQAGLYYQGINNTLPVTVTSFDVEDGIFYLLDQASNQVIIIDRNGNKNAFPIEQDRSVVGLDDITVTPNHEIYILNTGQNIVYQYSTEGNLIDSYELAQIDLFFPNKISFFEDLGVVISSNQEKFYSLKSRDIVLDTELPYKMEITHQKEAIISYKIEDNHSALVIPYEYGMGQSIIKAVTEEQVIFVKTERPPVYASVSESHIYALNQDGKILGGVRLPFENFIEKPDTVANYIQTDNNHIYFLSPEKEHIAIYELTLGKHFPSHIQNQVEEVMIGFDIETFGAPHEELEKEVKKLFTNNSIFSQYGDENSLNGVVMDGDGTVVVDFKHFLVGGPSTHQMKEISEAIDAAIFDRFPDVQKLYIQFDGSFSAWCVWMGITEDPWTRNK